MTRWHCADLREEVARRYDASVHESAIGKWLHQLGLSRVQPRPYHPQKDPDAEEAFKKLHCPAAERSAPHAEGKVVEIWFQDEARVGQQGCLEYIWAARGSRPQAVRDNRRDSVYLFGALCPGRVVGAAVMSTVR